MAASLHAAAASRRASERSSSSPWENSQRGPRGQPHQRGAPGGGPRGREELPDDAEEVEAALAAIMAAEAETTPPLPWSLRRSDPDAPAPAGAARPRAASQSRHSAVFLFAALNAALPGFPGMPSAQEGTPRCQPGMPEGAGSSYASPSRARFSRSSRDIHLRRRISLLMAPSRRPYRSRHIEKSVVTGVADLPLLFKFAPKPPLPPGRPPASSARMIRGPRARHCSLPS